MKKRNDKYLKFYRFEINLGSFKRERDFGSNLLPFSFGLKLSCAFPLMRVCSLVKSRSRLARVGTMQSLFITRRVGVFWYETSLDQLNIVRYPSNYCHIYIHHPHTDTIILPFPPHHPFAANRTNPCPSRSIILTLFRSMFTPGQKCLRWQKPGARLQTLECMRRAKANSSTPLRLMPFVHLDIQ